MKRFGVLIAVILVMSIIASIGMAEDKPWFDMKNCAFCSNMSQDLMDHLTYEQHRLSNGVMIITTFPPEYKEEFDKAMAAMQQLGMDLHSGKIDPTTIKICGHCEYYGKMMDAGAKFEHVSTNVGEIDIITSDNPDIQKMIMTYADNNDKAMAEMIEMGKDTKEE